MIKIGRKKEESVVTLLSVKAGVCFRFAHESFEDAMANGRIFMIVNQNGGPAEQRVRCFSIDGKEMRLFDETHRVVCHEHDTTVYP